MASVYPVFDYPALRPPAQLSNDVRAALVYLFELDRKTIPGARGSELRFGTRASEQGPCSALKPDA